MSLPGEVFVTTSGIAKKSAEAILGRINEPTLRRKAVEAGSLAIYRRAEH